MPEELSREEQRIRQIEERVKAAHPGPWGVKEYGSAGSEYINVNGPSPFKVFDCPESILTMQWPAHSAEELVQAERLTEATAEFIAHAREDIPWLLEQLHRRTPSFSEPSQTEALKDMREAILAGICILTHMKDGVKKAPVSYVVMKKGLAACDAALASSPAPKAEPAPKPECYDCDADTDDGEWKARHTNKPPCKYAEPATDPKPGFCKCPIVHLPTCIPECAI